MRILRMYPTSINARYIDILAEAVRNGEVVVIPTDTRYALACDALSNRAVERICRLKGIDNRKHPLSIVCADMSQASEYAVIDNRAFRLLKDTLPGPYTYILPARPSLPKVFKGRREVGVRVPDNMIARELARELGNPLMTSTVNWPDAEDEDTLMPAAIADALGQDVSLVVDAGDSTMAQTSVIDLTDSSNPVTLRAGS